MPAIARKKLVAGGLLASLLAMLLLLVIWRLDRQAVRTADAPIGEADDAETDEGTAVPRPVQPRVAVESPPPDVEAHHRDSPRMRSIAGVADLTGPMGEIIVVEGCGDRVYVSPEGRFDLWATSEPCRLRAVHVNGGASSTGDWTAVSSGGDRSGVVVRVPPAPEWQPLSSDVPTPSKLAQIARFEYLMSTLETPEERAELQDMLDMLYERAGYPERVPPATAEEMEAWRAERAADGQ